MTGTKVRLDLGVIDLMDDGSLDNKCRLIVPITGPMSRSLPSPIEGNGDDFLLWEKPKVISPGSMSG